MKMLLKEITLTLEKTMKIVLIILCAFLLKAEAEAQTWINITPFHVQPFNKMQEVHNNKNWYILINNEAELLVLKNGSKWKFDGPYSEYCGKNENPEYKNYFLGNIFSIGGIEVWKTAYGTQCNSNDITKQVIQNSLLEDGILYYDSTFILKDGEIGDWIFGAYSPSTREKYILIRRDYKVYLSSFNFNDFTFSSPPLQIEDHWGGRITKFLQIDSRAPIMYLTILQDTIRYESNGKAWSQYSELLYSKKSTDTVWKRIASVPLSFIQQYSTDNINLAFPVSETKSVFIACARGLWRYHYTTNHIDTLLKVPTRSIFLKENSTIAYSGTESGEIYRSSDAGETWSLFASGFSTKPVIGIYASGNDSLIVGTEDGIWANYHLPVSVTEETPFKNDELSITPNPANSSLKISFLKTDVPQQLSVYNSFGQLVFKTEFSGEFVWDFKNDIPDGVYTVTVQAGEKSVVKQVVILR